MGRGGTAGLGEAWAVLGEVWRRPTEVGERSGGSAVLRRVAASDRVGDVAGEDDEARQDAERAIELQMRK